MHEEQFLNYFSQNFSNFLFLKNILIRHSDIIYEWFNTWRSFLLGSDYLIIYCNHCHKLKTFIVCIFHIHCFFLIVYPVSRLCIWPTAFKVYFLTFLILQLDWIKNKIASFHYLILKEVTQKLHQRIPQRIVTFHIPNFWRSII